MAKKIPVPSDFSKPKPGAYLKKDETAKPKKRNAKPAKPIAGKKKDFEPKTDNRSTLKKEDHDVKFAGSKAKKYPERNHEARKTFVKPEANTLRHKPQQNETPGRAERTSETKHKDQPASFERKSTEQKVEKRSFNKATDKKDYITKQTFTPIPKTNVLAEKMPLNKYIAHCGICSRRDAVDIIKKGRVKVNQEIQLEPGYKVNQNDHILLDDKHIVPQTKFVYYLLNKPKDYITTTDDPEGRKTVLDLLSAAPEHRIYPVGRLDRNTTGLLLLTNDGDLAQKLSHPKNKVKKVYFVVLDKPLAKQDFEAIAQGVMLEDGLATVDEIAYIDPKNKKEIGLEIHIGRNRIVRRIFEHLNYQVKNLDRVIYAGLTKKNLQRGKWRELETKEVVYLKHFTNPSKGKESNA